MTVVDHEAETRPVLAGLSGAAADELVMVWAGQEAAMRGLPLRLIHVTEPGAREDGEALLSAAVAGVRADHPGLRVEGALRPGPVVPALVQAARHASLVVLGPDGTAGGGDHQLGSVAVHLTAHARCPVLVTHRPPDAGAQAGPTQAGAEYGPVVVGVDGSAASVDAVRFGFEEASWRGVGLAAVYAWQPSFGQRRPYGLGPSSEEAVARRVLAESVAGWQEKYPDVRTTRILVADHPVQALRDQSADATLLVVGSHGSRYFSGMLLGSVSQALVRHHGVTVAVVRSLPMGP